MTTNGMMQEIMQWNQNDSILCAWHQSYYTSVINQDIKENTTNYITNNNKSISVQNHINMIVSSHY